MYKIVSSYGYDLYCAYMRFCLTAFNFLLNKDFYGLITYIHSNSIQKLIKSNAEVLNCIY